LVRARIRLVAVVIGALALTTEVIADEAAKKAPVAPTSFYKKFLTPRMDSRLRGDIDAAVEFANPAANPWTRDDQTISRIEKNAIRATKQAVKRYALESLHVEAWSLPLFKRATAGIGALGSDSEGARLRFGFAHRAPRAELLIPGAHGRVALSADAGGHFGTWFESTRSDVRLGFSYDVPEHAGTFSLIRRF
jgi:hypothetical protein